MSIKESQRDPTRLLTHATLNSPQNSAWNLAFIRNLNQFKFKQWFIECKTELYLKQRKANMNHATNQNKVQLNQPTRDPFSKSKW